MYQPTDKIENLLDKDNGTISEYLELIEVDDFKAQIKSLMKRYSDKEPIKQAIEFLKKTL